MTLQQRINDITHDGVLWVCTQAWQQVSDTISQDAATKTIIDTLLCIATPVRRDTYAKKACDAIAKLNAGTEEQLKKLRKELTQREKEFTKANDDKLHNLRSVIDELYAAIGAEEQKLLPVLGIKDLNKYLKEASAERAKEKKYRQKGIFDSQDPGAVYDEDADDPWAKCPKFINADEVKLKGFAEVTQYEGGEVKRYGYYTYDPNEKTHKEVMNFTITPIFMIRVGRETRYMVEINNSYKKAYMDLEAKCMISIDLMAANFVREGNFMIYGTKNQFLRISSHLLQNFLECHEIKTLGWQPGGFYAMVDRLVVPQRDGSSCHLQILDEWGVSQVDKVSYIIPASSLVYKKLAATHDDVFENLRVLQWKDCSITFKDWARRMQRVYGTKGMVGVAYAVLVLFRDIAYGIDNNFPHLYGYGDMSSGKSKWGQSISAFFYNNRAAFNLNSGTDAAFFAYMSMFRNGVAELNEFDAKVIKPEWFQSIKGVYDGESRQRMNMADRSKVETQRVEGGLILLGQFLVTMDDNSVVSRSLIEAFSQKTRTEDDNREYLELKEIEKQGITSLMAEVLQHRYHVKDNYQETFNKTLSQWRKAFPTGVSFNQRIMQNWCHLFTALSLVADMVKIPADMLAFKNYCFERGTYWCNFIRNTDTLSEFWNTVAFLVDQGLVKYGWDFWVRTEHSITVRKGDETETKMFTEPTKILFIRLNNVHKLYESAFRQRTGQQGLTLDNLRHYSESRNYFLGAVKSYRFEKVVYHEYSDTVKGNHWTADQQVVKGEKQVLEINTSCQAYLYDDLKIDIERELPKPAAASGGEEFPPF